MKLIIAVASLLLISVVAGPATPPPPRRPKRTFYAPPPPKNRQLPHFNREVNTTVVPCTVDDNILAPLYRANLEPDLEPWRGRELSMAKFDRQINKWKKSGWYKSTTQVVLLYNNTLYLAEQDESVEVCEKPCDRYVYAFMKMFRYWLPQIPFPNVVFLLSVSDGMRCRSKQSCYAPFFSVAKKIRPLPGDEGEEDPMAYDILAPEPHLTKEDPAVPLKKHVAHFHEFPWELKSNKAVWRGRAWCGHTPSYIVDCSRKHTARLHERTELKGLADFALVGGVNFTKKIGTPDFARFKFLLNLDGMTAAYRLSTLMLMNSVVLKEESNKAEYFYRSLKEYEHYIPVYKYNDTDIIDIIKHYSRPEQDAELKRISRAGQEFAAKYTCPRARMLYWRKALTEYKKLFPDMDAAIEKKWWPSVKLKLQRAAQLQQQAAAAAQTQSLSLADMHPETG